MPIALLHWTPPNRPEEPSPKAPVRTTSAIILLVIASLALVWFAGVAALVYLSARNF